MWFSANDPQTCTRFKHHCPGLRHCACNTGSVFVVCLHCLGQLKWLSACHMFPALQHAQQQLLLSVHQCLQSRCNHTCQLCHKQTHNQCCSAYADRWKCFSVTLQVVLVGMHDSQILALSPTDGSVIASMDWLRTADKAAGEIRGIVLHEDNQALVAYSLHPRKDLTRYCRLCFSLRGDNVAKFDRRFGSNFTAQHHGAPPEHPPYAVFYASGVLACYNEQPHSGASLWSASLESLPAHQQSCSACARVEHTNVYATIPWRSQYLQLCGKSKLTFGYFGSMAYDKELWWDKMFAAAPNCCGSSPQILSACGVLLTQASLSRVAVWHFPDVPD